MFYKKPRVRNVAVVLVALHSAASFGHAQAHDVDEYVEVVEVHADLAVAHGADVETTTTDLSADAKARLSERIRSSTGRRTAPSTANNYGMVRLP